MKNTLLLFGLFSLLIGACGNSQSESVSHSQPISEPSNSNLESRGALLMSKSDCAVCHKDDRKAIGPSYEDIRKKYVANSENINLLASNIIKGSRGVWGTTSMTPHPKISEADAQEIVKYILEKK